MASKRYIVILTEWRLVIEADSLEDARRVAAEELKEKIKPEYLHGYEDPTAHYVSSRVDPSAVRGPVSGPQMVAGAEKSAAGPIPSCHNVRGIVGRLRSAASHHSSDLGEAMLQACMEIERLTKSESYAWKNTREIDKDRIEQRAKILALQEQVAALESREVCTIAHQNVETCGYCQRDELRKQLTARAEAPAPHICGD
jgi:hypothetical protein